VVAYHTIHFDGQIAAPIKKIHQCSLPCQMLSRPPRRLTLRGRTVNLTHHPKQVRTEKKKPWFSSWILNSRSSFDSLSLIYLNCACELWVFFSVLYYYCLSLAFNFSSSCCCFVNYSRENLKMSANHHTSKSHLIWRSFFCQLSIYNFNLSFNVIFNFNSLEKSVKFTEEFNGEKDWILINQLIFI
jgi:hypothetical protein